MFTSHPGLAESAETSATQGHTLKKSFCLFLADVLHNKGFMLNGLSGEGKKICRTKGEKD